MIQTLQSRNLFLHYFALLLRRKRNSFQSTCFTQLRFPSSSTFLRDGRRQEWRRAPPPPPRAHPPSFPPSFSLSAVALTPPTPSSRQRRGSRSPQLRPKRCLAKRVFRKSRHEEPRGRQSVRRRRHRLRRGIELKSTTHSR